ncbi:sodium/solute symporter [Pseudonocardia ailaonensis]|uniref:Sodium/solute symporter n=1 Tax=Pseudonocardia ailaonensis TaxID=367279 RepID=A0ABN2N5F7_9PSEU
MRSVLTYTVFALVVALTIGITLWAARRNTSAREHYVAGGQLTGWQNGFAIVGDFVSTGAILGTVGMFALKGVSAFFYVAGPFVALVILLALFAEPLRNLGRFTMADVVASRFGGRAVRTAMAVNALLVTVFYMIAQLVAAGVLISYLLGVNYGVAVAVVGVLMTIYISLGGMVATSWIQIVKAALLIVCVGVLVVLVLARFDFDVLELMRAASAASPVDLFVVPGGATSGLDLLSVALGVGLGTAALPHVLVRFLTVPSGVEARRSMNWALVLAGFAFIATPFIGYGAVALLGRDAITAADKAGNLTTLQVAEAVGGPLLFAIIAAVAFATILAVVAGLVITGSGALAHDLYGVILRKSRASDREQVWAGRVASLVISVVAIVISLAAHNTNVAVLGAIAVVVAASANVPVLLCLLFWRRFTSAGMLWGIGLGLGSAVLLVILGPQVQGPGAPFPLAFPTLVSIPLGFLGCVLGSLVGGRRGEDDDSQFRRMQLQAAIGRPATRP